jgi:hypothetical protein
MILSGSAVHVNGLGSWFVSATKRSMAAWRSTTYRKTPLHLSTRKNCSDNRAHLTKRACRQAEIPLVQISETSSLHADLLFVAQRRRGVLRQTCQAATKLRLKWLGCHADGQRGDVSLDGQRGDVSLIGRALVKARVRSAAVVEVEIATDRFAGL